MQSISPVLNDNSPTPLYIQLYRYIREAILHGEIKPGEKLPSLRRTARDLHLSTTTVQQAYAQLTVEGYIDSRPQSGYYACHISRRQSYIAGGDSDPNLDIDSKTNDRYRDMTNGSDALRSHSDSLMSLDDLYDRLHGQSSRPAEKTQPSYFDRDCFDFTKWKKCTARILNDYSDLLLVEGDPQGEAPLRYEISNYIYQARGVKCQPGQIVIGAGTQQLTGLLCTLLSHLGIEYAAFEEPGYLPVRDIFRDRGFKMTTVPLDKDGILIDKLPQNIRSVAYVSPSNQFPTGAVMPAARCYDLLHWARQNDSIIIEDDYNSELRYLGKAAPCLQGLDDNRRVVYLGSFSSTLFPAVKISYMVLPVPFMELFSRTLSAYTQTCSKTEQLTLALYMEKGFYQTNIRKLRSLYAQKMQLVTTCLKKRLGNRVQVLAGSSGLHMLLALKLPDGLTAEEFCRQGRNKRLPLHPISEDGSLPTRLIFYYTRIPMKEIEQAVEDFSDLLLRPADLC